MSKDLVDILMERDRLSRKEAEKLVTQTREELFASFDEEDGADPEEIIANNLGLELDYIFDLI